VQNVFILQIERCYMKWICLFLKRYRPDTLSLFYVCADNSGHLHHVDRLAFFQICKVSNLA
jgi:hypothetical protein